MAQLTISCLFVMVACMCLFATAEGYVTINETTETATPPRDTPGWSAWYSGTCSATCGTGTKQAVRICHSVNYTEDCMGPSKQTETCSANEPCAVDGGWGSWLPWNQCSQTCGGGSRSRLQVCDNPKPADGGSDCHGVSQEGETCNSKGCSDWSDWFFKPCAVTCGTGTKQAVRSCSSGHVEDCTGPSNKTETCTKAPCPVNGGWSSWLPWNQCSQTCGGGSRSRAHSCDNPKPANGGNNCHGDSRENDTCNIQDCPDWGAWFYKACSVTCGTGAKQAVRSCSSGHVEDCTGPSNKTETCTKVPCPVDGVWGSWLSWNQCSQTCGGGSMSRARVCDNPKPSNGGNDCHGDSRENGTCNSQDCPVDGEWGSWLPWNQCSQTCGGGSRSRARVCDNPAPSNGGSDCHGDSRGNGTCNSQDCPGWSDWFYSACSVTCGTGTKHAVRTCSSGHVEDCSGSPNNTETCTDGPCPAIDGGWGSWQAWGTCSASCDDGVIRRQRACDNPLPQYGGQNCSGNATETKQCHLIDCPRWSDWFSSPCTVTCGTGTIHDLRVCSSGHVEDCAGSETRTEPCTEAPCPAVSEMCYDCKAIPYPRDCDQVVRCTRDSRCYTDEYVTASGNVLYNTGCRSISRCTHNRREIVQGGEVIFKMDADDVIKDGSDVDLVDPDAADDAILCEECCHGDFCNSDGCNSSSMLPAGDRGPMCFNCHQQSNEDSCNSVTQCDIRERCQLTSHVFKNEDVVYTTGCMDAAKCDQKLGVGTVVVGRRQQQLPQCDGCCSSDYCNRNCSAVHTTHSAS